MGVDLKDWLAYVRAHPLKFRFAGLAGGRSSRDDFHQTVGEAAVADERFMDDYFYDLAESIGKDFDAAVAARADTDEILSRFCAFAEHRLSAYDWNEYGFLAYSDWNKAPIESIMLVVHGVGNKLRDAFIQDWEVGEPDHYWEMIKSEEEEEYLLKEHPPEAVWCNAAGEGVDVEDVFFLCPSCDEPQTEEDLRGFQGEQNGHPIFYCGSCGSSMNVGQDESIVDFFIALDVTPYPFNAAKREKWTKLIDARRDWGDNKLELKVGEKVHLKAYEDVPYNDRSEGTWRRWKDEPGELVTVSHVTNTTTKNGEVTTCAGIVSEEQGFAEFHRVFGRPLAVAP